MINIVHIIVGLNRGGAEQALRKLVCNPSDMDCTFNHTVVSLTDIGYIGVILESHGIQVLSLNVRSFLGIPSAFLKLRRLLYQLEPDIVQTWMYHADFIGGLAARSIGIKNIVWNVRSTDISKGGSKITIVIRWLCALLSSQVPKKIICVADASRRLHEAVGYSPHKMLVIPNGFEVDKMFCSAVVPFGVRHELGIGSEFTVVISVGRYNPVKDHKTFIDAAGTVALNHNDLKFIMVGRDVDNSNQQLLALIEATGQADAFYLLGERTDVLACLQSSDIFCLHSVTEGFPNVLGEAMAVGLPCITTDVGDAAYLLDNPEWVVPAASPDKLAHKLNEVLSLPVSEREALGQAAAIRISENFTMDLIGRRYHDLYASLICS